MSQRMRVSPNVHFRSVEVQKKTFPASGGTKENKIAEHQQSSLLII